MLQCEGWEDMTEVDRLEWSTDQKEVGTGNALLIFDEYRSLMAQLSGTSNSEVSLYILSHVQ